MDAPIWPEPCGLGPNLPWLKREPRPEVPNATLPLIHKCLQHAADYHFGVPPGALKWCKIVFVHSPAPRCVRERLKRQKSVPLGPQGCQKYAKSILKGGKKEPKRSLKSHYFQKLQNVSSIHYLLYISHIGTSQKPLFFVPWGG